MTSSTLVTEAPAPVRARDRARTALRSALPAGRLGAGAGLERDARAERRALVRAERARRRATALQFGAYPATRSTAGVLLPRDSGA